MGMDEACPIAGHRRQGEELEGKDETEKRKLMGEGEALPIAGHSSWGEEAGGAGLGLSHSRAQPLGQRSWSG